MYKEKECLQNAINEMAVSRKAMFEMLLDNCKDKKDIIFGDYCDINIGGTPSTKNRTYYDNGKNLWLQISDMKNKFIYDTKEKITDAGINNSSVKKININDIMVSFKLSIGKVAIAKKIMYCNEAIVFFNGGKNFLSEYLYFYFLVTNISEGKTGCIGTGSLNKEKLNNLKIIMPSLDDQQKIISQMDKFDILEQLQKEHITELDNIIKQRFNYHLSKCKKEIDITKSKEEYIKPKKKINKKIQSDSESEEIEEIEIKQIKKKVQSDSDIKHKKITTNK